MDRGRTRPTYDTSHHYFSPSLSKRFFSPPLPSIQMSSINSYPNGTSVNNRGQALKMWVRLKLMGREYYLVQQLFVNHKVTTARQLRISKGGTMGRMDLCQRSYNKKPCSNGKCVRVHIPAFRSRGSQRTVSLMLFSVRWVSDSLSLYAYPRIILKWLTAATFVCSLVCLFDSSCWDIARWWTMTTPTIVCYSTISTRSFICFLIFVFAEVRKYIKQTTEEWECFICRNGHLSTILFICLVLFIYLVQLRKRVWNPVDELLRFIY